jgi:Phosphoenolpyruvate synthase/pyruvate phosphate dikinase
MSIKGKKLLYDFSEGSADMKALLGGKGANLAQMMRIGLPVPPGFTLDDRKCAFFTWKTPAPRWTLCGLTFCVP